jgi:UDP-N-acetylglucosamine/UDP-N-acetylgalactosamine diphosphorylase
MMWQVWFIKQDSMPCISSESSGRHDVLLETPWKVAQAPNGNGGLYSALHGEGIIDRLIEEGIEFVQVRECSDFSFEGLLLLNKCLVF